MRSPERDSVAVNREHWTRANAAYTDASALEQWTRPELRWGVWGRPERCGRYPTTSRGWT
jgi:hypothetical protein